MTPGRAIHREVLRDIRHIEEFGGLVTRVRLEEPDFEALCEEFGLEGHRAVQLNRPRGAVRIQCL